MKSFSSELYLRSELRTRIAFLTKVEVKTFESLWISHVNIFHRIKKVFLTFQLQNISLYVTLHVDEALVNPFKHCSKNI